ncbi:hypothetical protein MBEHAL_1178 [Halarchaeum acidiphilum MH1-52-1]|uniref:Uncharacterized protein n=1 Tax=Halarchaeum acidiphilum MH1-52-1 TaxID=1261545 RepID=U3ACB7_9EURY|nr:hypothetical protein [Halarchaeum acidiphilum]GAD52418.1 hypothetical protein MBEHAL_1178 [Halarchaeum acidiphilum MH1-52-1]
MADDWRDDDIDAVLRVLAQGALGVSPAGIAANTDALLDCDLSIEAVEDALDALGERGLVETVDSEGATAYYRLSEHGRDYADVEFAEDAFGYVD